MKTLTLSLKKQWFDMINAGVKKEEYREIKPNYIARLFDRREMLDCMGLCSAAAFEEKQWPKPMMFVKHYDRLVFTLGYPKTDDHERRLTLKNPKIRVGTGRPEWGAEHGKLYFVISWDKG